MTRFICSSCNKKRLIKYEALKVRLFNHESRICVKCWEDKFNCDKSKLIYLIYNYENIILNKKMSSSVDIIK